LGLEKTPEEFVANMVAVFREVRRVLRDDGTLWLNIGDSYNANQGAGFNAHEKTRPHLSGEGVGQKRIDAANRNTKRDRIQGIKPKDLVGIPWLLAFALRADGWWLRSEIIWAKPNPMPESVTDRPTKAHEQIFLLTKAERYFYDAEAVKEISIHAGEIKTTNGNAGMDAGFDGHRTRDGFRRGVIVPPSRNLRTVWTIPTQPYPGSHFATFPEELAERCIKAGTSEKGACPKCGAPFQRLVDVHDTGVKASGNSEKRWGNNHTNERGSGTGEVERQSGIPFTYKATETIGYIPSCGCGEQPTPCLVLDPFFGSGTVGRVCRHLRRNCIGIDLNADYLGNQARARVSAPLDRDVAKQAESIPGQKTMF
jgi:DNA modification methylase